MSSGISPWGVCCIIWIDTLAYWLSDCHNLFKSYLLTHIPGMKFIFPQLRPMILSIRYFNIIILLCFCLLYLQGELFVGDLSGSIHVWDLKTDQNEHLVWQLFYFVFFNWPFLKCEKATPMTIKNPFSDSEAICLINTFLPSPP